MTGIGSSKMGLCFSYKSKCSHAVKYYDYIYLGREYIDSLTQSVFTRRKHEITVEMQQTSFRLGSQRESMGAIVVCTTEFI